MVHKMIVMKDVMQMDKKLTRPEIRIWVHPKSGGDDFYFVNTTMAEASTRRKRLLASGKYAKVETPLIAFSGYEMSVSAFKKKYPKQAKQLV